MLPLASNANQAWPDFSFIQFGDWGLAPGRAIRTSRWKYAVTASDAYASEGTAPEYTESHLYDLEADPYELSNLIESKVHETVKVELRAKMLAKMKAIKEPACKIIPVEQKNLGQREVDYIGS